MLMRSHHAPASHHAHHGAHHAHAARPGLHRGAGLGIGSGFRFGGLVSFRMVLGMFAIGRGLSDDGNSADQQDAGDYGRNDGIPHIGFPSMESVEVIKTISFGVCRP